MSLLNDWPAFACGDFANAADDVAGAFPGGGEDFGADIAFARGALFVRKTAEMVARLLFGQMPTKIAAIVKDAENIDYALAVAGTIDDEVPRALHNSRSGARPFAAETQVIRPNALLKVALVFRAWTLDVGLDIAEGLDNEVFVAQGGITPKLRLAPYENLSKIAASLY